MKECWEWVKSQIAKKYNVDVDVMKWLNALFWNFCTLIEQDNLSGIWKILRNNVGNTAAPRGIPLMEKAGQHWLGKWMIPLKLLED